MAIMRMKPDEVERGMIVNRHGYSWEVMKNEAGPDGLRVMTASALGVDNYAFKNVALGFDKDEELTVKFHRPQPRPASTPGL